jgi:hypothetical protein
MLSLLLACIPPPTLGLPWSSSCYAQGPLDATRMPPVTVPEATVFIMTDSDETEMKFAGREQRRTRHQAAKPYGFSCCEVGVREAPESIFRGTLWQGS